MREVPGGLCSFCSAGVVGVLYTMYQLVAGCGRERAAGGDHTEVVSKGLRLGMALFITSEVLFFFAFFWAFFWGALVHPGPEQPCRDYSWLPEGAHPCPDLGRTVAQYAHLATVRLHGDLGPS